jgi:hypothetical protein
MAEIVQRSLFQWQDVESSAEIVRLERVLKVLPDEELVDALERERDGRRDDYPIRALWNSLFAGIIFQHVGIASLIRELKRNGELRQACGFDPLRGAEGVPPDYVYSRFLKKLLDNQPLVEKMFDALVKRLSELLPDLGARMAVDSKALPTWGSKDADADWGVKETKGVDKDGNAWQKITKWFGYKLHLLVDATYELPIAYEVTKASTNDSPRLLPLVEKTAQSHPQLVQRAEQLSADKGYDSGDNKAALYDEYAIMPLIDTRDMAGGEMKPLDDQCHDTIYVSGTGEVCCKINPFDENPKSKWCPMQFQGYEKDRQTLKFRCPAAAFGVECNNQQACQSRTKDTGFGRVVRVNIDQDRRIHLPCYRHGRVFEEGYKKRTAVERVNSRIDQVYGFERHAIRGLKKMTLRIGMALVTMAATAVAWIENGMVEKARSLLQTA